ASLALHPFPPRPASSSLPLHDALPLYVSVLAGTSASVALAVTASALNSSIVWLAGTLNTGATFTSRTVTVKLLVALNAGTPLSVTTTVIVFVHRHCASLDVQQIVPLHAFIVMPPVPPFVRHTCRRALHTLSLHVARPICVRRARRHRQRAQLVDRLVGRHAQHRRQVHFTHRHRKTVCHAQGRHPVVRHHHRDRVR